MFSWQHLCVGLFSSVQLLSRVQLFGPHEPQHTRPLCPSPTPGVHPNPCPLSWWRHPTISSSVVPFSSCLQSFLASESSQMSQLFASGGQSIGVSASTSVLPMNTQEISFRMDWLRSRKLPELMVLSLPLPQQLKFYYQPLPKQLTDFRKAEKCSWHASTSSNISCFLLLLLLLFIFITCTQYWYTMDRQWKIT